MKKSLITRDRLIILASIAAAVSLVLFFFADVYQDKADFVLIVRGELMDKIELEMRDSDISLLLYEISDKEDASELYISAEKLIKARKDATVLSQLYPKYQYYKSLEKVFRYLGLTFVVLSIIFNAIALIKKE